MIKAATLKLSSRISTACLLSLTFAAVVCIGGCAKEAADPGTTPSSAANSEPGSTTGGAAPTGVNVPKPDAAEPDAAEADTAETEKTE